MAEYVVDKIEYGGNIYKLQDNQSGYLSSIKTINNTSLVGSGNVTIKTPDEYTLIYDTDGDDAGCIDTTIGIRLVTDGAIQNSCTDPQSSFGVDYAVQGALVSGDNIKTINNTSLLGSGNISIPVGTVTSVGLSNATNGGITVSGSPVSSSGTITIGHSNVLTNAQTTEAVYPIKIDKNGHISSYGTAISRQTAASGGTTLSLVNTGDMYDWNNKGKTTVKLIRW